MRFSTVSGPLSVVKNRERCWLLIALIVRQSGEIICKAGIRDQKKPAGEGSWFPLFPQKTREGWATRLLWVRHPPQLA